MKSHTHYLWFNTKKRQEILDVPMRWSSRCARAACRRDSYS